ncbi:MAG: S24 family peptidase [Cyanobacteria bacterium J06635_1]
MGFPISGDAIEQSLDLNQHLIKRSAATFFLRVADTMTIDPDVQAGDLLIVDRALSAQPNYLVVAVIEGELTVTRSQINPPTEEPPEIWGVVTALIRQFP